MNKYIRTEHICQAVKFDGTNKAEILKALGERTGTLWRNEVDECYLECGAGRKIMKGCWLILDKNKAISMLADEDFKREYTELKEKG